MTTNPISAITGVTTDRILDDELVREFVTSVMLEAQEIGARLGVPIDEAPSDRHAVTLQLGAMKTSMLQDIEARKAVELEALFGSVCELGANDWHSHAVHECSSRFSASAGQALGLYPA
jgi:2-dehydropantoate 2-reductase